MQSTSILPIMLATLRNKYNVRKARMRRRTDAFSRLVGARFDRSTQSHARADMFGGAKAPTLTGLSKEFLPAQRALLR